MDDNGAVVVHNEIPCLGDNVRPKRTDRSVHTSRTGQLIIDRRVSLDGMAKALNKGKPGGRPLSADEEGELRGLVELGRELRSTPGDATVEEIKTTLRGIARATSDVEIDRSLRNCDAETLYLIRTHRTKGGATVPEAAAAALARVKPGSAGAPVKRHHAYLVGHVVRMWLRLGEMNIANWARGDKASPLVDFTVAFYTEVEGSVPPRSKTRSLERSSFDSRKAIRLLRKPLRELRAAADTAHLRAG
jgi:hypothetical protein